MSSTTKPRHRNTISNEKKASLRAHYRLHNFMTYKQLADWFQKTYNQQLDKSSIARILSSRYDSVDSISSESLQQHTRRRKERWPELERALIDWIQRAEKQIIVSQEVIRTKAKQFWPEIYPDEDMPGFTNGWLIGFQNRANIKWRPQHGEAGSLAEDSDKIMAKIRRFIAAYSPQDVFNCDESSLYWKLTPDRGLSSVSVPGRKKQKSRISVHFCCNSDGSERFPLLFIGTAKKPRSFAGININNFNCTYRSNTKAWMTGEIFKEWLIQFDNYIGRTRDRKVVLLMDNFSAHESAVNEIENQLRHLFILWLPPNSTTKYQPLDQGIINNWKVNWRRNWVLYMVKEFDRGVDPLSTISVLQAIRWGIEAWSVDIKVDTIRNCFNKALHAEGEVEFQDQELLSAISASLRKLQLTNRIQDIMNINEFLNPAGEEVDDSLLQLDEIVLSQFAKDQDAEDQDAEMVEPTPIISIQEALEGLKILRLYEEQQQGEDSSLLRTLIPYERLLTRQKVENQRQKDIRSFFG